MPNEALLCIGTLNRETPYFQGARGDGLALFGFDDSTLTFRKRAAYPQVENPTFLSFSTDGRRIYTNSEVAEWREGLVTAFDFHPASGRLDYLNTQASLGSIAAHNFISRDGHRLFVVNSTVGKGGPDRSLAVFDLQADGVSPAVAGVSHKGSGPDPARQDRAHAQSVTEVMQGGMVIVADLGMDALITYRIGADGMPKRIATAHTAPGAGPRHVALHQGGRFVFVMNALDCTVTAHDFDPATGKLAPLDRQSALPDAARGESLGSDIQISADGLFLYGSLQGHDSIAVFAVDQDSGRLAPLGLVPCGGSTPRHMALTPSGRHLLVANQTSDRVSVLARDAASGGLSDTGAALQIGSPMCLKFAGS